MHTRLLFWLVGQYNRSQSVYATEGETQENDQSVLYAQIWSSFDSLTKGAHTH